METECACDIFSLPPMTFRGEWRDHLPQSENLYCPHGKKVGWIEYNNRNQGIVHKVEQK